MSEYDANVAEATAPLVISGVRKRFGDVVALRDVSLELAPGEITGLLGPNGAGKTTLTRICAGWLDADAGHVAIMGEQSPATNRKARARLGVVSRDAEFNPAFYAGEALAFQAALYGLRGAALRAACDRAIETYRLGEYVRRPVGALSTGMYQRLALAAALVHEPSVVLMDEPTTGLDPDVRLHIWECIAALRDRGAAVLLTTHYIEEAVQLCASVCIMTRGSITCRLRFQSLPGDAAQLQRAYLDTVRLPPETTVVP